MAKVLNELNAKWFTIGDPELMMSRAIRKIRTENYIMMIARIQTLSSLQLYHASSNWASDGSMKPAASGIGDPKSVIAALTGPSTWCFESSEGTSRFFTEHSLASSGNWCVVGMTR